MMKKTTAIVILLTLLISQIHAQQIALNSNIDDYIGTWRYENPENNETFTIKLKKAVNLINNTSVDCVIGTYLYMKNGNIVSDNMVLFNNISNVYKAPIYAREMNNNCSILQLAFDDQKFKKQTFSGTLTIILGRHEPNKLKWILKEDEGDEVYLPDEEIPPHGFSVPDNVVLTKVE